MWHGDFDNGWARAQANFVPFLDTTYPEDPAGPDEIQKDGERFLWRELRQIKLGQVLLGQL